MKFFLQDNFQDRERLSWFFVVAGVIGLIFAVTKFSDAFPAASIDLKLPRQQIQDRARSIASSNGFELKEAMLSTIFDSDDDAKTFLEYKLGLSKANDLMRTIAPTWYWSTRFFHSLNPDDLTVNLAPDGTLIELSEHKQNDPAITSVSVSLDEAQQMCSDYAMSKCAIDLKNYKLASEETSSQGGKVEHTFLWRQERSDLAGAHLDVEMGVTGNRINRFHRFVGTPEPWPAEYRRLRSYNQTLHSVVQGLYYALYVISIIGFFWAVHAGLIRWRFAIFCAMFVGVMFALQGFNSIDSYIHKYPKDVPFDEYVMRHSLDAVWIGLMFGSVTLALAGAAETAYRFCYPAKLAAEAVTKLKGISLKQTITSLTAGCIFFGLCLGWVVLYYVIGTKVGLYTPLENLKEETLSTIFPFWSAMTIGIFAAVHEELLYRVICLSIVRSLLKNFWLANLVQAAAWAFMHTTYPQEPAWTRGAELTVFGFMAGAVLRQYGILACIVSHYLYDAFLGVTPLFNSSVPLLRVEALGAVSPFLLLVVIGICLSKRRQDRAALDELINANLHPVDKLEQSELEPAPAPPFVYRPMTHIVRVWLFLILIATGMVQFTCPKKLVGHNAQFSSSRNLAIANASEYLHKHHVSTQGCVVNAKLENNLDKDSIRYILDNLDLAKTEKLAMMPGRPLIWEVSFDKPEEHKSFVVELDAKAVPQAMEVHFPSVDKGAHLSKSDAQKLVETFVRSEHPELVPFKIASVHKDTLPGRTDYQFTLAIPTFKVASADYLVKIDTVGDVVSGFTYWWDLPDKWSWNRTLDTKHSIRSDYLMQAFMLFLLGGIGWWMIALAKDKKIHWRDAAFAALIMELPYLVQGINRIPQFYSKYDVDTPLNTFIVRAVADSATVLVSYYLLMFLLAAFAMGALKQLQPGMSLQEYFKTAFLPKGRQVLTSRDLWIDAILLGYAASMVVCSAQTLLDSNQPSKYGFLAPLDVVCSSVNTFSPYLNVITRGLNIGLITAACIGILAALDAKYLRNWWVGPLLAALIAFSIPSKENPWSLVPAAFLIISFCLYLLKVLIGKVGRANILAYILCGFSIVVVADIRILRDHALAACQRDVGALAVTLFLPLAFVIYLTFRSLLLPPEPKQETASVTEFPVHDAVSLDQSPEDPAQS